MPVWVLAALRLIAGGIATGAGFGAASGYFGGDPDAEGLDALTVSRGGGGGRMIEGQGGWIHSGGHRRRRRRRRALTASDRADIAFIAGIVSKQAAKDFAVQLATRSR